jgi:hypothetical protein
MTEEGIDVSGGSAAWVENCEFEGLAPYAAIVVIKNCKLGSLTIHSSDDVITNVFLTKNIYFMRNNDRYLNIFGVVKNDPSHCYLYADTHIPGTVYLFSGNVHIYNAEIEGLTMMQQHHKINASSLNLENVTIRKGNWKYADLRQGNWQNVRIFPPVALDKARIGAITGHRVEFPQGIPWTNGTLTITESPTPLEFDKPPVPTLEELGLAQFWRENDFPEEKY